MLYVKNVPTWERALRIVTAIALLGWGAWGGAGPWAWAALASAAGLSLTGLFGFCPACALVGRRLTRNGRP
jgi:hypothetical protein